MNPRANGAALGALVAVLRAGVATGAQVPTPMLTPLPAPTPLSSGAPGIPRFVADPWWPKPLPGSWMVGQVSGVAVDAQDHVWIIQRPNSLTPSEAGAVQAPPIAECCVPAPPVIEFDGSGTVLRAWGGPTDQYHWPESEHSIYVDHHGDVWVASNGPADHVVLKFTPEGRLLLQIGTAGKTGGSNDTTLLGAPAAIEVDDAANEVYIGDGYVNKRVIVFDATTGAYRRHWGAYGHRPEDRDPGPYDPEAPPAAQFRSPVHAVRIGVDGLVYVADRANDRIQVFTKQGTYVREVFVAKNTRGIGSAWDLAFSRDPDQRYLFVADGTNHKVWILTRKELRIVGAFGRGGRNAGYFGWVHNIAVDSKGDIFTTEVATYGRLQKFTQVGAHPVNGDRPRTATH
jgi:DNA-binding beta-propeller fold protein YncE